MSSHLLTNRSLQSQAQLSPDSLLSQADHGRPDPQSDLPPIAQWCVDFVYLALILRKPVALMESGSPQTQSAGFCSKTSVGFNIDSRNNLSTPLPQTAAIERPPNGGGAHHRRRNQ